MASEVWLESESGGHVVICGLAVRSLYELLVHALQRPRWYGLLGNAGENSSTTSLVGFGEERWNVGEGNGYSAGAVTQ